MTSAKYYRMMEKPHHPDNTNPGGRNALPPPAIRCQCRPWRKPIGQVTDIYIKKQRMIVLRFIAPP